MLTSCCNGPRCQECMKSKLHVSKPTPDKFMSGQSWTRRSSGSPTHHSVGKGGFVNSKFSTSVKAGDGSNPANLGRPRSGPSSRHAHAGFSCRPSFGRSLSAPGHFRFQHPRAGKGLTQTGPLPDSSAPSKHLVGCWDHMAILAAIGPASLSSNLISFGGAEMKYLNPSNFDHSINILFIVCRSVR